MTNKKHRGLVAVIAVLVSVLVLIQAVLINDLYKRTDKLENDKVKSLVVDAIRSIGRPLVTDPTTGKEYVPEAHLVLPPFTQGMAVSYDGDKDAVQFGLRSTVDQGIGDVKLAQDLEKTFKRTSTLQACVRQVEIRFTQDKGDPTYSQAGNKKLADGRTAYFFTANDCTGDRAPLLEYVKQVESY